MDSTSIDLREALERDRKGRVRWRCPAHLRAEVVSYVAERREAGSTLGELGRELGLSESCLGRWLSAEKAGLRPVQVTDEPSSPSRRGNGVVLVTPRGYRIEGLDVSSAAALLRQL